MRIFNEEERLNHSLSTIGYYFGNEYQYYSKNNTRSFTIDNDEYLSLYKRLNIQLLITKKCPFNCAFCIEKVNPVGQEDFDCCLQLKNLQKIVKELKQRRMEPTVSITGGEPMIFPEYLKIVKTFLDKNEVQCNLNTSGYKNNHEILSDFERINLSVHDYDSKRNSLVFGTERDDYWNAPLLKDATIQTVLQENNCNISYVKKMVESFNNKRFSIRFLTETDTENSTEWKDLFYDLQKDPDFIFVQQKIGDYYFFEEYKYKEKVIRFSFSSLKQLKYLKDRYEKDKTFVRAIIILPNGKIQYDWI